MFYLHHTPTWLRWLFPKKVVWEGDLVSGNEVYLTFDDGPHEEATPFVLEQLKRYNMKACFFCIGKNVVRHPEIYRQLLADGHTVGNHTMHHVNGKITDAPAYVANIEAASRHISSNLFRPPYGQITRGQVAAIGKKMPGMDIVMWTALLGDFDTRLSGKECFDRTIKHIKPGSIIVMHDSEKAFPRLTVALPLLLEWVHMQGLKAVALGKKAKPPL